MSQPPYRKIQRMQALAWGVLCHLAFAAAVLSMMVKLYGGMQAGPTLPLPAAILWDAFLILQFPLFHSLLLTPKGGQWMARLIPGGLGKPLRTTTFAIIASLQILLCFLFWAPLGSVFYELHGLPRLATTLVYIFGWGLLMKSMADAGLGVQMGYKGWWAVWKNQNVTYSPWAAKGTLRHTRHPMYLAYTLLLWSGPVWTLDHVAIASTWSLYCIIAPLHKEARYKKRYGQVFQSYQKNVPYFLPRFLKHKPEKSS
ncbi:DUF1295 domain-containing protein [Kiritimatiellota bacterium B12222]|nr:DUF1295 domain-containing protein [Kiritimatiellota bacterium B12222]